MSKKLTDENMDQLLRRLVNDTGLDSATTDEIADSPQLWWGVKRRIAADEKPLSGRDAGILHRWLIFGAPLAVAALLLVAFFAFKPQRNAVEQALIPSGETSNEAVSSGSGTFPAEPQSAEDLVNTTREIKKRPLNPVQKTMATKKGPRPQQLRARTAVASAQTTEVKSEFIALSYARNPESGQIVRVKVPSSMMVSLGLVATVERPNNLVNAELLVGDDGMTHAIRFIR